MLANALGQFSKGSLIEVATRIVWVRLDLFQGNLVNSGCQRVSTLGAGKDCRETPSK
jgi:hypothetical protein